MILTCPSCETKFNIDSAVLGDKGRRVKCTKCAHVWLQAPPKEEFAEKPEKSLEEEIAQKLASQSKSAAASPFYDEEPKSSAGKKVALLITAVLAALYFGRGTVIDIWEPSALLFETVGLEVPVPGEGLSFQDITIESSVNGGVQKLTVQGFIVNETAEAQDIPTLKGSIVDRTQQPLYSWTFKAERNSVSPIESVPFKTEVENSFDTGERVAVTFAH